MRGAWIEIRLFWPPHWDQRSLLMRGAWIEISLHTHRKQKNEVAPHAGSVD